MKHRLTSLLVLGAFMLIGSINGSAQNLLLPLVKDSSHSYTYTSIETKYTKYYFYNNDGLLETELDNILDDNVKEFARTSIAYNSQKLIKSFILQKSNVSASGPWADYQRGDKNYDGQNRLIFNLTQQSDGANGWVNAYKETYWFNDGTPASDSMFFDVWDIANNVWANNSKQYNHYYPDGNLKQTGYDSWDGLANNWEAHNRTDFTYYPDGKLLTQTSQYFVFYHFQIDSFTYRPDGKPSILYTFSRSAPDAPFTLFTTKFQYDPSGNLVQKTLSRKNQVTGTLEIQSRTTYQPGDGIYSDDYSFEFWEGYQPDLMEYYPQIKTTRHFTPLDNGRVLYEEVHWTTGLNGFSPQFIDSIWFSSPQVGIYSLDELPRIDCRFSNPFSSGDCIICRAADQTNLLALQLTNSSGQLVAQAHILSGENWYPAGNLPAGMYFLSVWQNGKYLGERKMIVQ